MKLKDIRDIWKHKAYDISVKIDGKLGKIDSEDVEYTITTDDSQIELIKFLKDNLRIEVDGSKWYDSNNTDVVLYLGTAEISRDTIYI